jgi:hypothetical protein
VRVDDLIAGDVERSGGLRGYGLLCDCKQRENEQEGDSLCPHAAKYISGSARAGVRNLTVRVNADSHNTKKPPLRGVGQATKNDDLPHLGPRFTCEVQVIHDSVA